MVLLEPGSLDSAEVRSFWNPERIIFLAIRFTIPFLAIISLNASLPFPSICGAGCEIQSNA